MWRNKLEIDILSLDDLHNNIKIYEPEVKGTSSSNTNIQNIAFVSSNNTNSTNGAINTAHDVTTANTKATDVNSTTTDNLSDAVICAFFSDQAEEESTTTKKRSRTHGLKRLYKVGLSAKVESFEDKSLDMFDADQDLGGEEVFVAQQDENVVKKEVDAAQVQVITAATTFTISIDEVTLAQALVELKHTKPKAKAKGIVFHEPEESKTTTTTTTTTVIHKSKSQDKGKAKMIKEHEQRLVNERAQEEEEKEEEESNIALIESWDDVQSKINADYQLAEILQAEEQQELNDEEKATLFMQLLEKRRKFFLAKRAEELEQESSKKQKIDDEKDIVELKQLVKIIPDEEGTAINAIPLAVKPPSITD
nr:hypothetical protein [Tanacetum cinerariifolium]